MANKKGRSEKKTSFFGKEYVQHYDSKGNKSGRSEKKTTFFGNKYTQHFDSRGEKVGKSEKKETWTGRTYTQKYNSKGEKSGRSEKKETWYGKPYTQHYDSQGQKTDWSERKETWYGKLYVQRYGENTNTGSSTYSSSRSQSGYGASGGSGGSYGSTSSRSYGSGSAQASSSSVGRFGLVLLLSVLFLAGVSILIGSRTRNSPSFVPQPASPANAYVNTVQLNLRRGPGTGYGVVTRLSKGDSVACLERSQNQQGEMWIHIRSGSSEGWVNEKYLSQTPPLIETPTPELTTSTPTESPSETGVTETVPSVTPPFALSAVRFFESGNNAVAYGQRFYATRFSAAQSRFIFWELNLIHANPHERYDFTIHAIWRNADGSVLGEQDVPSYFESNWTSSYHDRGWGRQEVGWWRPGTYTVDLYFQNTRLATRSFEIY